MRVALSAVVFVLAPLAPAQSTTWIVDASGGPGAHFTSLPAAVAAAADGDVLVVRSGSYAGFRTGKALAVLGQGGVMLQQQIALWGPPAVEIDGLPAGKTFALAGVTVAVSPFGAPGIHLHDNAGRIHLQDVDAMTGQTTLTVALEIERCLEVTVGGGSFAASPAVRVSDSTVSLAGVTVAGQDAVLQHAHCEPAFRGLEASNSIVYLARTDVRGGNGAETFFPLFPSCAPQPAALVRGGIVVVSGDATTTVAAGTRPGLPVATPAITASAAAVDPTIALQPAHGGAVVRGTVAYRRVVSIVASGAPPGGAVNAEIVSAAGEPVALLVGLPEDPLPTAAGLLFVDPQRMWSSGLATQGPSEHLAIALRLPPLPQLRGTALALQAVHIDLALPKTILSNPAIVIVD